MAEPTHTADQDWKWTKTANPAEDIFTVFVQGKLILNDTFNNDGTPNVVGNKPKREVLVSGTTPYAPPTEFKDIAATFNLSHLNNVLGVSNWQFIGESDMGPTTAFHFFRKKDQLTAAKPWKKETEQGNHYWHAIVKKIWDEVDYDNQVSQQAIIQGATEITTSPAHNIMADIIEHVTEGTQFITSYYQSATQPLIRHHIVPQGDTFTAVIKGPGGDKRSFDNVLHPLLILEPAVGTAASTVGSSVQIGFGGGTDEQRFAPTNRTSRKEYVLSDKASQNEQGLWLRIKVKVIPPKNKTERPS